MIECPICRSQYVTNTLFCEECGLYLLGTEKPDTDPLESEESSWLFGADSSQPGDGPSREPLTVRLRIGASSSPENEGDPPRELLVSLVKPIRLGRIDPLKEIYPDIDLTADRAMGHGVSRVHACIFGRGNYAMAEDLGSTNGTLLNGKRLAPYLPERLRDGDQLQLGKLLIEVHFEGGDLRETGTDYRTAGDPVAGSSPDDPA
jgi:pSer/pThr/pTyr-binding forkhead associated (FHA) protein